MKLTSGQALLPLLIIIVIALGLGTAVIELSIGSMVSESYFQRELSTYFTTEAALENGFLRLLRNPNYLGEDLQINDSSCTIEVSGESPKVISAKCDTGYQVRKIQAEITYNEGKMEVGNIGEVE